MIGVFESTGEVLDAKKREAIETVFDCRAIDRYGNAEFGVLAYERMRRHGSSADGLRLHRLARESAPREGHERAGVYRLCATTPCRWFATAPATWPTCKPPPTVSISPNIVGRVHDLVRIGEHRYPTHYLQDLLDRIGGIDEFQVVERDGASLLRLVVPDANHRVAVSRRIERLVGRRRDAGVHRFRRTGAQRLAEQVSSSRRGALAPYRDGRWRQRRARMARMMNDVERLAGYHSVEHDELGPFVWTEGTFHIRTRRAARFAVFKLCYYGEQGTLTVRNDEGTDDRRDRAVGGLAAMCRCGSMRRPATTLAFAVAPLVPVAGDSRELGLMLREMSLVDDESSFARVRETQLNLRLNQLEYAEGRAVLTSSPPAIRVNLEVRCNIPETSQACAYCAWDWAKESERGSPPFTLTTLDELGDFYRQATEVNDCSIGEPTMNKQFGAIVLAHRPRRKADVADDQRSIAHAQAPPAKCWART